MKRTLETSPPQPRKRQLVPRPSQDHTDRDEKPVAGAERVGSAPASDADAGLTYMGPAQFMASQRSATGPRVASPAVAANFAAVPSATVGNIPSTARSTAHSAADGPATPDATAAPRRAGSAPATVPMPLGPVPSANGPPAIVDDNVRSAAAQGHTETAPAATAPPPRATPFGDGLFVTVPDTNRPYAAMLPGGYLLMHSAAGENIIQPGGGFPGPHTRARQQSPTTPAPVGRRVSQERLQTAPESPTPRDRAAAHAEALERSGLTIPRSQGLGRGQIQQPMSPPPPLGRGFGRGQIQQGPGPSPLSRTPVMASAAQPVDCPASSNPSRASPRVRVSQTPAQSTVNTLPSSRDAAQAHLEHLQHHITRRDPRALGELRPDPRTLFELWRIRHRLSELEQIGMMLLMDIAGIDDRQADAGAAALPELPEETPAENRVHSLQRSPDRAVRTRHEQLTRTLRLRNEQLHAQDNRNVQRGVRPTQVPQAQQGVPAPGPQVVAASPQSQDIPSGQREVRPAQVPQAQQAIPDPGPQVVARDGPSVQRDIRVTRAPQAQQVLPGRDLYAVAASPHPQEAALRRAAAPIYARTLARGDGLIEVPRGSGFEGRLAAGVPATSGESASGRISGAVQQPATLKPLMVLIRQAMLRTPPDQTRYFAIPGSDAAQWAATPNLSLAQSARAIQTGRHHQIPSFPDPAHMVAFFEHVSEEITCISEMDPGLAEGHANEARPKRPRKKLINGWQKLYKAFSLMSLRHVAQVIRVAERACREIGPHVREVAAIIKDPKYRYTQLKLANLSKPRYHHCVIDGHDWVKFPLAANPAGFVTLDTRGSSGNRWRCTSCNGSFTRGELWFCTLLYCGQRKCDRCREVDLRMQLRSALVGGWRPEFGWHTVRPMRGTESPLAIDALSIADRPTDLLSADLHFPPKSNI